MSDRVFYLRFLKPFSVIFFSFFVLHVIGGWHYYLKNSFLLFSTIVFFVVLYFVTSYSARKFNEFPVDLSLILKSMSYRKVILFRILILIGSSWGVLIYYVGIKSGLTLDELRVYKSQIFPPAVVLILNGIALTGYVFLAFSEVARFKVTRKLQITNIVFLLLGLLGAAATGTRAVLAPYLWFTGVFLFIFSLFSARKIIFSAVLALVSMASVKLFRLIYSDSQGKLDYYIENGVYQQDNILLSIWNILRIHLEDNAWRAYMVFQHVPERMNWQFGKSTFFDFYSLLPGEQISPHVYLSWNVMYGAQEARGYPPTLLAQGWLDYGFLGSLIYAFAYPLIILFFFRNMVIRRSQTSIVFYYFILFNIVLAWYGAINWVFVLLFCLIYKTLSNVKI